MTIMEAISYATEKHDGQQRKVDLVPYIAHPYRVAMLLMQAGHPESVVIAGLLHDVVEDTETTLEEIRDQFGDTIAELVDYASEPDKSLPWQERKQHTIDRIKQAPLEARLVVCADKIDNLTSILDNEKKLGPTIWNHFKRDKQSQQWYYTSIYESLTHNISEPPQLFTTYKKLLEQFV